MAVVAYATVNLVSEAERLAEQLGIRRHLVPTNGTELYCEIRGSGPSLAFIGGATADAEAFAALAEKLSDEFIVLTYDRRGYSRSPRPAGWTGTSTREQADDAAGLIEATAVAPAAVFGSSAGANIALELLIRRPDLVRVAVLHEPFILSLLGEQAEEIGTQFQESMDAALAASGPREAMESLIRPGIGEDDYERLDAELRERLLAGAETLFGVDMGALPFYQPDEAALAAIAKPVKIVLQESTVFSFIERIAARLVELTGADLVTLPGSHAPFLVEPSERLVEAIRDYARGG